jgi:hypothetical protein
VRIVGKSLAAICTIIVVLRDFTISAFLHISCYCLMCDISCIKKYINRKYRNEEEVLFVTFLSLLPLLLLIQFYVYFFQAIRNHRLIHRVDIQHKITVTTEKSGKIVVNIKQNFFFINTI